MKKYKRNGEKNLSEMFALQTGGSADIRVTEKKTWEIKKTLKEHQENES